MNADIGDENSGIYCCIALRTFVKYFQKLTWVKFDEKTDSDLIGIVASLERSTLLTLSMPRIFRGNRCSDRVTEKTFHLPLSKISLYTKRWDTKKLGWSSWKVNTKKLGWFSVT